MGNTCGRNKNHNPPKLLQPNPKRKEYNPPVVAGQAANPEFQDVNNSYNQIIGDNTGNLNKIDSLKQNLKDLTIEHDKLSEEVKQLITSTNNSVPSHVIDEQSEIEKRQLDVMTKTNTFITDILAESPTDEAKYENLESEILCEVIKIEDEISNLKKNNEAVEPNGISKKEEELHRLAHVIAQYRPISKPQNLSELFKQLKIDCAEGTSQTIHNIKALIHHIKTGDKSNYVSKPMRGLVYQALKMGDIPHDKWSCELCLALDPSDTPLLT